METRSQVISQSHSDPSVLQSQHQSTSILDAQERILTCRRNDRALHRIHQHRDPRVLRYLVRAGFYGLYRIGYIQLDWPLITAFVERWHVETHTFHLPVGESTVTLQDVSIITGLPVDGDAVTGVDMTRSVEEWQGLCHELLGLAPPQDMIKGGRLKLTWLTSKFEVLPDDADDETVQQHTRACILMMIGGHLLSDKSQNLVKLMFLPLLRDLEACSKLSWGAAGLACLYREMCRATSSEARDIAGALILLQLWAWERLSYFCPSKRTTLHRRSPAITATSRGQHTGVDTVPTDDEPLPPGPYGCRWHVHVSHVSHSSLRHYRDHLNALKEEQMIWQPYTPDVIAQLPDYCLAGQGIWRTRAPLICFDVVELHLPDRVLRQFGMRQQIPHSCDTYKELHATDRRGRPNYDWEDAHRTHITHWRERHRHVVNAELFNGRIDYSDPYMRWYRNINQLPHPPSTVPPVTFQPVGGTNTLLLQSLTRVYQISVDALHIHDADAGIQALQQIQDVCCTTFAAIDEERRLSALIAPLTQAPPSIPPQTTTRTRGVVVKRSREHGTRGKEQGTELDVAEDASHPHGTTTHPSTSTAIEPMCTHASKEQSQVDSAMEDQTQIISSSTTPGERHDATVISLIVPGDAPVEVETQLHTWPANTSTSPVQDQTQTTSDIATLAEPLHEVVVALNDVPIHTKTNGVPDRTLNQIHSPISDAHNGGIMHAPLSQMTQDPKAVIPQVKDVSQITQVQQGRSKRQRRKLACGT